MSAHFISFQISILECSYPPYFSVSNKYCQTEQCRSLHRRSQAHIYFEEISVDTADDSDDTQSEDDNENVLSDYRYYMHDKNKKEVHCASCCMT